MPSLSSLSFPVQTPPVSAVGRNYDPAQMSRVSAQMAAQTAWRPDLVSLKISSPPPIPSIKFDLNLDDVRQGRAFLKSGDKGASVQHIQERLKVWGEPLDIDHDFGQQTTQAVLRFQKSHGLERTGRVGSDTLRALEQKPLPQSTNLEAIRQGQGVLSIGTQGQAVEHIQQRLRVWGYAVDRDRDFGPQTALALQQFQNNQNLPTHGWVDQKTLAALEERRVPTNRPVEHPDSSTPPTPSSALSQLRAGDLVLKNGDRGEAVEHIQERLRAWGYQTKVDGDFGPKTAEQIRLFQRNNGIKGTSQVGETTLTALEKTPSTASVSSLRQSSTGQRLAQVARRVAAQRDTVGWCYAGVADSVSRAMGVSLWGGSAYMAAPILAKSRAFTEVKGIKASNLPKLPAGAVIVWGKTAASPNGHISVALGDGREASDHIDTQRTQLRGHTNFRIFMPR